MSIEATFWAWTEIRAGSLPFRARLVLLALADRHNKNTDRCDPSKNCICIDTGIHHETVGEAIKQLESSNIIFVSRKLGARSSYKFVGFNYAQHPEDSDLSADADQSINTDSNQSADTDYLPHKNQSANTDQSINTDSNQSVNTDTNLLNKPINKTHMGKHEKATSAPSAFSTFYDAYPGNRKNRGEAKKAWDKLNPSDELIAEIMSGLDRAKQSRDWLKDEGQFIPGPAAWLNKRRWEDEINSAPLEPNPREQTPSGFLGIAGLI